MKLYIPFRKKYTGSKGNQMPTPLSLKETLKIMQFPSADFF